MRATSTAATRTIAAAAFAALACRTADSVPNSHCRNHCGWTSRRSATKRQHSFLIPATVLRLRRKAADARWHEAAGGLGQICKISRTAATAHRVHVALSAEWGTQARRAAHVAAELRRPHALSAHAAGATHAAAHAARASHAAGAHHAWRPHAEARLRSTGHARAHGIQRGHRSQRAWLPGHHALHAHWPGHHARRATHAAHAAVALDPLLHRDPGALPHGGVCRGDDDGLAAAHVLILIHVDLRTCVQGQLLDGGARGADELADEVLGADDALVNAAAGHAGRRHARGLGSAGHSGGDERVRHRRRGTRGTRGTSLAAQIAHHVAEVLVHLRLLLRLLLPVHVVALVRLRGLLTVRRDVASVSTDRTDDVRHLVILVVGLRALKAQMAQGATDTTTLLGLVETETADHGQLLHAVGTRVLELRTLGVEQWLDKALRSDDLLLRLTLDVHVLRHRGLLVALPLVADVAAADENLAAGGVLQPLVVHATRTDDDTHERCLRELFDRNDDLLEQLGRLPVHWRQVALNMLDHVSDQPVVLGCHGLPDPDVASVQSVTGFVVHRWWRWWTDVWVVVLELVRLDLSVEILQPLLAEELIDLLLRQAHGKVHIAQRLVGLVIKLAPSLALLGNLALSPPGLSLGPLFERLKCRLMPCSGQHDGMRKVRRDVVRHQTARLRPRTVRAIRGGRS
mmetsp:Transcript_109210/g.348612  ORF Transcript_109210/g.348612 Transcript_109210/m.348612 type:complete len:687 (-) Transcript_109210:2-2062(-)